MGISNHDQKTIDEFFQAIELVRGAYQTPRFTYLALRQDNKFILVKGVLLLDTGLSTLPLKHFQSQNLRAGQYRLSDLGIEPRAFLDQLLSGLLTTPEGELQFPEVTSSGYVIHPTPFHPLGLQNQNRLNVLKVSGANPILHSRQPALDWELRAAPSPYDGVADLVSDFQLGVLSSGSIEVEIFAVPVALIDSNSSSVAGTKAQITVRLALGLSQEKVMLGYRAVNQGNVLSRSSCEGSSIHWTCNKEYQQGRADIDIPEAAALHCFVSYAGMAQHYYWLADPATVQNPRRAVYETFDSDLKVIKEIIARVQMEGKNARELEAAVAWLSWMLGFNVAHLGDVSKNQDAADVIATTPYGHFLLIECTTGSLKGDKLSKLHARTQAARRKLESSNCRHLKVLPVIVTSKARTDISPDIEQAEKQGILVITRENLELAYERTLILLNADQLYADAEKSVIDAKARHEDQGTLALE